MQNAIIRTHRANQALGLLLLGRDYAAKQWHAVFGPLVAECVEHLTSLRGTLNFTAASTTTLRANFDHAMSDGVVTPQEAAQLRAEIEAINKRVVEGDERN